MCQYVAPSEQRSLSRASTQLFTVTHPAPTKGLRYKLVFMGGFKRS
jgi:hypothetical protein